MIKKNITLKITLLFLLLLHPLFSEAFDVVVLKSAEIKPYNDALEGFMKSCDCSVDEITYHDIDDSDISSRVRNLKPDAVLVIGMDALKHAQLIKNIPVIYAMVPQSQPASPEQKNISGVSMYISPDKYFSAMMDVFPNARRIGVVYDPHFNDAFVKEALRIAQARGVELVLRTLSRSSDAPGLIAGMKDRIDVFLMLPDPTVVRPEVVNYLLLFSFQHNVPVFAFSKKYLEMGALAGLNIIPFDIGVQAGEIAKRQQAERVLHDPIRVHARKTVIMINRKIANKLGIKISDEVLKRAEDVN